ncbi:putative g-protein coupled receptor no9 [Dermatophagoides farinae]|uniref:G-protein coupled receptor no9 n=1 Tax=Dermatophagoides farinae TaxID=6954 RepID=A0A9D4SHJ8_DERFA|nr:putative g-protein coupled receptor no9 [Dermatophagoides farinae]
MEMSLNHSGDAIFNLFSLLVVTDTTTTTTTAAATNEPNNNNDTTTINNIIDNQTRFIRTFSYFTDNVDKQRTLKNYSSNDCFHSSSSSLSSSSSSLYSTTTSNQLESFNDNHHQYIEELLKEKFNNATVIISVIILVLINIMVIFGNILVILSVFASSKLRTVTNFFIVSLAVADFLVGIAVLPYSLTFEILDTWIFGEVWCQGWLVIDVWMCTASILNLCAISVDRYLAVTRPVRYRSLMTAKRAKFIIAGVWIISFIICFPPLLLGKQESFSTIPNINPTTSSSSSSSSSSSLSDHYDPLTYQFSSSSIPADFTPPSSLSSSSSKSFSSKSSSLSWSSTSDSNNKMNEESSIMANNNKNNQNIRSQTMSIDTKDILSTNNNNQSPLSIKMNKGKKFDSDFKARCKPQPVQCALFRNKSYVIYSAFGSFFIPMFVMIFLYWKIYLVAIRTSRALKKGYRITKASCEENQERLTLRIHRGYCSEKRSSIDHDQPNNNNNRKELSKGSSDHQQHSQRTSWTTYNRTSNTIETALTADNPTVISSSTNKLLSPPNRMIIRNGSNRNHHRHSSGHSHPSFSSSPSSSREGSARSNKVNIPSRPTSKRASKYQAKRFHAETKAAKTVGIIVGGFIVCWLPFFIVYLTRAFCVDCIPNLLFSIFFWLGYCNSMINPCIYGLFSRDFRRAFKNIICRCRFREETSVSSLIRQIHMPTFFEDMPEEMAKHESQDY